MDQCEGTRQKSSNEDFTATSSFTGSCSAEMMNATVPMQSSFVGSIACIQFVVVEFTLLLFEIRYYQNFQHGRLEKELSD